ncbi:MAG: heavy-metal-associated domain-containing protein [Bacteroidales bacterium]|nr:heavy-metal-associated domain-containing protein [Bacteroidales bacterium]MBQ6821065.1 heavy-metal-associated domain-containing protein [Bacteroidales bacterium]MBR0082739.1 heavy-metal-associated domain-containing protein [Bacteroidales bacterium]
MRQFMILLALVQVVFASNIHCANCSRKVQDNIAFEKGVKDLKVDVEGKTITVVFNPAKTDTLKLKKAINKLGYTADVIEYNTVK